MPEGQKLTEEQIRSVMPGWVLDAVDQANAEPPADWVWVDVSDYVGADSDTTGRVEILLNNTNARFTLGGAPKAAEA
jgi:hypothetical protein